MAFTMKIKGKTHKVTDLAHASRLYCELRERSLQGASRFASADVLDAAGNVAATISYNGRVWDAGGSTLIMEAQG